LDDVREVVGGPGGDQLAHSDGAEGGVGADEFELIGTEIESDEAGEVGMAGGGEFVEELGERLAGAIAELGFPVEGFKGACRSVLEDYLQARDPVCLFPVDEMADDDLRAPGAGAFGGVGPGGGQVAKERVQRGGRALQQRDGFFEEGGRHIVHYRARRAIARKT